MVEKRISLSDRISQLEQVIEIRTRMIDNIEDEKGFDSFKMNTADLKGELRALKNVRLGLEDQKAGSQSPSPINVPHNILINEGPAGLSSGKFNE